MTSSKDESPPSLPDMKPSRGNDCEKGDPDDRSKRKSNSSSHHRSPNNRPSSSHSSPSRSSRSPHGSSHRRSSKTPDSKTTKGNKLRLAEMDESEIISAPPLTSAPGATNVTSSSKHRRSGKRNSSKSPPGSSNTTPISKHFNGNKLELIEADGTRISSPPLYSRAGLPNGNEANTRDRRKEQRNSKRKARTVGGSVNMADGTVEAITVDSSNDEGGQEVEVLQRQFEQTELRRLHEIQQLNQQLADERARREELERDDRQQKKTKRSRRICLIFFVFVIAISGGAAAVYGTSTSSGNANLVDEKADAKSRTINATVPTAIVTTSPSTTPTVVSNTNAPTGGLVLYTPPNATDCLDIVKDETFSSDMESKEFSLKFDVFLFSNHSDADFDMNEQLPDFQTKIKEYLVPALAGCQEKEASRQLRTLRRLDIRYIIGHAIAMGNYQPDMSCEIDNEPPPCHRVSIYLKVFLKGQAKPYELIALFASVASELPLVDRLKLGDPYRRVELAEIDTSATQAPSMSPSKFFSENPTTPRPSWIPTEMPSSSPSTPVPSVNPSLEPSSSPSRLSSTTPTSSTPNPTNTLTSGPNQSNTPSPSPGPMQRPTIAPTRNPTTEPNQFNSPSPSTGPSQRPTIAPTRSPTREPNQSNAPSPLAAPSQRPSSSLTKETKSPASYAPNTSEAPTMDPNYQTKSPKVSPPPTKTPTAPPTGTLSSASCSAHQSCFWVFYYGQCCPTVEGVFLSCCTVQDDDNYNNDDNNNGGYYNNNNDDNNNNDYYCNNNGDDYGYNNDDNNNGIGPT